MVLVYVDEKDNKGKSNFIFLVHIEPIIFIKLEKFGGIYLFKIFSVYIFALPPHADMSCVLLTHPPDHLKWSWYLYDALFLCSYSFYFTCFILDSFHCPAFKFLNLFMCNI